MKRIWSHAVALLVLGLGTGAIAPACVENNETIFIRNLMAPPATRQNVLCTYTADPATPFMGEGDLDVGVRDDYIASLLVGSQMIPRGDQTMARAEGNRIVIKGGVSRVTDLSGALIREFTTYVAGFADTQANNAPGWGVAMISVIDAPTRDILLASLPNRSMSRTVLVNVRVFGRSLGGVDVESGEFQFPLRVCNGCLVSFVGANDPAQTPSPNCLKPLDTQGGTPCRAGQDESTPCQMCADRPACDPLRAPPP